MKDDVQIKRLCIEQERRRAIGGRKNEVAFEYDSLKDRLLLSENTVAEIGKQRIVSEFLKEDKWKNLVLSEDEKIFQRGWKRMLNRRGKGEFELRIKLKKDYEWYRINFFSFADENGEVIRAMGCAVNIQKRKDALQKMKENLQKDKTSGVKNAFATQFYIDEYMVENAGENGALLLLKVTGMEQIFDNLGRIFASAVFQNLGEILKDSFCDTDIVGRISADEFLVFMKKPQNGIPVEKAEEICRMTGNLYTGEKIGVGIQVSAGLASFPQDGRTYRELYRCVQAAAEHAGHQGNGIVMEYASDMKLAEKEEKEEVFPQERESSRAYDMEFLSFTFTLLSYSLDINSAINLLLERIGKKYNLSGVYIVEKNQNEKKLILTNFWEYETGIGNQVKSVEYEDEKEFGEFDQNGFCCLENCEAADNHESGYQKLCGKHVKSIIACNFEDTILGEGNVCFSDCKQSRSWSQEERNTLYECSKMISVFISMRKERFRDKKKITELLSKDQLTGLLNRQAFESGIKKILKGRSDGEEYGLAFCDINDFEYVNSNFGMEAGNQILCDYARNLRQRDGILLGCRIYSDCFLALYCGRSAEEIQEDIQYGDELFVRQQKTLYPASNLSMATGICFCISGVKEKDTTIMIENANLARKRAKKHRHNRIEVYYERYRKEKEHEQQVAGSICDAMNNEELELFLQPKFSLTTRRIIGAEALVRWRREDGTLRMPAEFIPVLEKVGYIVEMDFYIYEKVLKCMQKWKEENKLLLPISVNFSRCHIRYGDFVKRICVLAEKYNVEPGLIEIEITESSLSENNRKMIEDLSKLQENGFKVDIDDFGTGYSSLEMLLRAPVDTVKVDRSFLENIDKSEKERRYVERLAHLISAAEKEIVFEGVETEHQAKILTECGYTMAQGYLFGRPISWDEFDRTYMVRNGYYAVSGT